MRTYAEICEELDNVRDRMSIALQCGNIGVWDWNIETGFLYWYERNKALFRVSRFDWHNDYDSFARLLEPDDAAAVKVSIEQCIKNHTPYDYRFRLKDGRVIRGSGKVYYRDGEAVRMIGVNIEDKL